MALSIALLRHRLAAGRGAVPAAGDTPRPDGPLLWAHLCPGADPAGARLLIDEFAEAHEDVTLVSSGEDAAGIRAVAPRDTAAATRGFLDHWRPDLVFFAGPDAHPVLWEELARRRIPLIAVDTDPHDHPLALVRPLASARFVHMVARDPRLLRHPDATGRLLDVSRPPRCRARDLDALTDRLKTRPVWLATALPEAEVEAVIAAHRTASRMMHRLLLVIEPRNPDDGAELSATLEADGWRVALRSSGEELTSEIQILILDDGDEGALGQRLATVSYMGGSFLGGPTSDPALSAALGSVIVSGPERGDYARFLERLEGAEGAVGIASMAALGDTVDRLLVPDAAARMALAAWSWTTNGAEASNAALRAMQAAFPEGQLA